MESGNSGGAKCVGTPTASATRVLLESFPSLWKLVIRGSLWLVLCCLTHSGTYSPPNPQVGVLLCFSTCQAFTGSPGKSPTLLLGASGAQRATLSGVFHLYSADVPGERDSRDGSTPCVWLSSITLLPCLPGFPSQKFPSVISSIRSPWAIPHSQQ